MISRSQPCPCFCRVVSCYHPIGFQPTILYPKILRSENLPWDNRTAQRQATPGLNNSHRDNTLKHPLKHIANVRSRTIRWGSRAEIFLPVVDNMTLQRQHPKLAPTIPAHFYPTTKQTSGQSMPSNCRRIHKVAQGSEAGQLPAPIPSSGSSGVERLPLVPTYSRLLRRLRATLCVSHYLTINKGFKSHNVFKIHSLMQKRSEAILCRNAACIFIPK